MDESRDDEIGFLREKLKEHQVELERLKFFKKLVEETKMNDDLEHMAGEYVDQATAKALGVDLHNLTASCYEARVFTSDDLYDAILYGTATGLTKRKPWPGN